MFRRDRPATPHQRAEHQFLNLMAMVAGFRPDMGAEMQVAVAKMAEGNELSVGPARFQAGLDLGQVIFHFRDRHADIEADLAAIAEGVTDRRHIVADIPERLPLALRLGDQGVDHQALFKGVAKGVFKPLLVAGRIAA